MPFRIASHLRSRAFTSATRARTAHALPSQFYGAELPNLAAATKPHLGRVSRWYLPTMALIAVGMIYLPQNLFSTFISSSPTTTPLAISTSTSAPSQRTRTSTLDTANSRIGFAIANALEDYNRRSPSQPLNLHELQEARNRMLLDAYGARNSLEDMERAFAMAGEELAKTGTGFLDAKEAAVDEKEAAVDEKERNRRLLEAYGDKTSLRDVERAMEIYEVQ